MVIPVFQFLKSGSIGVRHHTDPVDLDTLAVHMMQPSKKVFWKAHTMARGSQYYNDLIL